MFKIIILLFNGIFKKIPTLLLAHIYVSVLVVLFLPLIFGNAVSVINDFFMSEHGRFFLITYIIVLPLYAAVTDGNNSIGSSLIVISATIFTVAFCMFMLIAKIESTRGIQIDYTIDELNKKDEFVEAIKLREKLIITEGKDCTSYKIRIKKDSIFHTQPFESMKYTRNKTDIELHDREQWGQLCDKIKLIRSGYPASYVTSDIEKKEIISLFQNLYVLLSEYKGTIGVYIRGHADKQKRAWQRELEDKYKYEKIPYYQASGLLNTYSINDSNLITHSVPFTDKINPGFYGNYDLPYLRANFTYENYFRGYLEECIGENAHGGVLEGVVLPIESPDKRNTDIFLSLCPDSEKQLVPGCSKK